MANQLIGTIVSIGPLLSLTTKTGNTFTKRDLVISIQRFDPNTGQPYSDKSNTPQISFMNDKCAELDKYQPGQLVRVSFDVTGNPYVDRNNETKIINDIRGYKIEPYGTQSYQRSTPAYPQQPPQNNYGLMEPQSTFTPPASYGGQQGYPPQSYQQPQQAQQQFGQPQMPASNTQSTQKEGDGLPF